MSLEDIAALEMLKQLDISSNNLNAIARIIPANS